MRLAGTVALGGIGAVMAAIVLMVAGCGNQCSNFAGYGASNGLGCGGGPPIPPQSAMQIEGTPGTPFIAIVSDTIASYTFNGVVPMGVVYVNNTPPVQMIVTNRSKLPSVISVESITGGSPVQVVTSNLPGGTVTVNVPSLSGQTLAKFANPPECDARFYVNGPAGDYYQSLIESQGQGYENSTVAPTLYFLGQARGTVTGVFVKTTNYTLQPLTVDETINGQLMTTKVGTTVQLQSGCP